MFLRKIEVSGEKITLIQDIGGEYKPDKRIRGHQLGYRTTPNSYDAWDLEDYRRYYLDLMFFGCNTVEHIPYDGLGAQQNRLMKYDPQDFLVKLQESRTNTTSMYRSGTRTTARALRTPKNGAGASSSARRG